MLRRDDVGDLVYLASGGGNMFFAASDAVIRTKMFGDVKGEVGPAQIERLVGEMVQLIVMLNDFLSHVLGQFMFAHLVPTYDPKPVGKALVPHLHDITLPFWTHQDGKR
jgi:hypothetical protein